MKTATAAKPAETTNYLDLATEICKANPKATVVQLAQRYVDAIQRDPNILWSLAVEVMDKTKARLQAAAKTRMRPQSSNEARANVIRTTAKQLNILDVPVPFLGGKPIGKCTPNELLSVTGALGKFASTIKKEIGGNKVIGEHYDNAKANALAEKLHVQLSN